MKEFASEGTRISLFCLLYSLFSILSLLSLLSLPSIFIVFYSYFVTTENQADETDYPREAKSSSTASTRRRSVEIMESPLQRTPTLDLTKQAEVAVGELIKDPLRDDELAAAKERDVGEGGVVLPDVSRGTVILKKKGERGESGGLIMVKAASERDILTIAAPRIKALGILTMAVKNSPELKQTLKGKDNLEEEITQKREESMKDKSRGQSLLKTDRVIPQPPALPRCWPPDFVYATESQNNSNGFEGKGKGASIPIPPSSKPKGTGAKTKTIYWDAMEDEGIEGTLWSFDVSRMLPSNEVLFSDIEEVFSIENNKKLNLKVTDGADISQTRKKMFIDPQRGQAIGIMLAKFGKRSVEDIAAAIQALNLSALGISEVNSIRNLLPTPEESESIAAYVASGQTHTSFISISLFSIFCYFCLSLFSHFLFTPFHSFSFLLFFSLSSLLFIFHESFILLVLIIGFLRSYVGSSGKLGTPERYILVMSGVPSLGPRLDTFLLANSYEETLSNVGTRCDTILNLSKHGKGQ